MKVKITATVTLETELHREDYADVKGLDATSDAEIIDFEFEQMRDEPWDSGLVSQLMSEGELSAVKIEKIEEASPAQSEAA
jgi:hypothetical protein